MQRIGSRGLSYLGFRFGFDEPNLNDGVRALALPAQFRIVDVVVSVPIDWTGTTPTLDLFIDDAEDGLVNAYMGDPVSLGSGNSVDAGTRTVRSCNDAWSYNVVETVWTRDERSTLFVCVSRDGTRGGLATGSDQGEAIVMLGGVAVPL